MKTSRILLAKTTGLNTAFCSFTLRDDGMIRVGAYATYTAYQSDFVCTPDEAKDVWAANTYNGYVLDNG